MPRVGPRSASQLGPGTSAVSSEVFIKNRKLSSQFGLTCKVLKPQFTQESTAAMSLLKLGAVRDVNDVIGSARSIKKLDSVWARTKATENLPTHLIFDV